MALYVNNNIFYEIMTIICVYWKIIFNLNRDLYYRLNNDARAQVLVS